MKRTKNVKLTVTVESRKGTNKIVTNSVYDHRTESFWSKEQIAERGITKFLDVDDMKETLNWNLNGDSAKYRFKWGGSGKVFSTGVAYIAAP